MFSNPFSSRMNGANSHIRGGTSSVAGPSSSSNTPSKPSLTGRFASAWSSNASSSSKNGSIPQSPPSPASFATPEILDISSSRESLYAPDSPPTFAANPSIPQRPSVDPPRINLSFDTPSLNLSIPNGSTSALPSAVTPNTEAILGSQAIKFRRQASAIATSATPRTPLPPSRHIPASAGPSSGAGFTGRDVAYANARDNTGSIYMNGNASGSGSLANNAPSQAVMSPAPSSGGSSGSVTGSASRPGPPRERFGFASPAKGSFGSAIGTPGPMMERTRERYGAQNGTSASSTDNIASPGLGSSYGSIGVLSASGSGGSPNSSGFLGPAPSSSSASSNIGLVAAPRNGSFGGAVGSTAGPGAGGGISTPRVLPLPSLPASPRPPQRPAQVPASAAAGSSTFASAGASLNLATLPMPPQSASVVTMNGPKISGRGWPASAAASSRNPGFLFGSDEDHEDEHSDRDYSHPFASTSASTSTRRPAPTPLRIPAVPASARLYPQPAPSAKNQNHTTNSQSSRPQNARSPSTSSSDLSDGDLDLDLVSAVSGVTLAAALGQSFFYNSPESSTAARSALPSAIGSAFAVLPHSNRNSGVRRRRSKGVTRQDSATLPRGEHPFLTSPYWRDKRVSGGGEIVRTPGGAEEEVPPVPPMPASLMARRRLSDSTLESPVVPPLSANAMNGEVRVSRRASVSSFASSARSRNSEGYALKRRSTIGEGTYSLILEDLLEDREAPISRAVRRISRISEATSPTPSIPLKSAGARSDAGSASSHSLYSEAPPTAAIHARGQEPPDSAGLPPQPGSANSQQSQNSAGSGESGAGSDMYINILDGYSFVSPLATPNSAGMGSMGAPSPGFPGMHGQQQTQRRSRGLSAKSPLGRSAFGPKDLGRRKSGKRGSGASVRSNKSGNGSANRQLLPIGVQQPQIQIPSVPPMRMQRSNSTASSVFSFSGSSIPITVTRHGSSDSRTSLGMGIGTDEFPLSPTNESDEQHAEFFGLTANVRNSGASEMSTMSNHLPPTPAVITTASVSTVTRLNPRTIFARPRAGSIPKPITVVRDSRDNTYNIALSSDGGPDSASASAQAIVMRVPPPRTALSNVTEESSAGGTNASQTFPETPRAFSPTMWTPGLVPASAAGTDGGVPSMMIFGGVDEDGEVEMVLPPPLMRSASVAGAGVLATLRAKMAGKGLGRSATMKAGSVREDSDEQDEEVVPAVPALPKQPARAATMVEQSSAMEDNIQPLSRSATDPALAADAPALHVNGEVSTADKRRSIGSRSSSPARRLPITPASSGPPSRLHSPLNPVGQRSFTPPQDRSRSSSPFTRPAAGDAAIIASRRGSTTSLAYLAASAQQSPAPSSLHLPTVADDVEDELEDASSLEDHTPPPESLPPRLRQPPGRAGPPSPTESLLFGDSTVPHASFVPPPAYQSVAEDLYFKYPDPGPAPATLPSVAESSSSANTTSVTTPQTSSNTSSYPTSPVLARPSNAPPTRISRVRSGPSGPRPFGPRKPSMIAGPRPRNTSVSSIKSNGSTHTLTQTPASTGSGGSSSARVGMSSQQPNPPMTASLGGSGSAPGPRFETNPVVWKSYTLDVAKWTFTSEQLQAIVSRAIRHSADATTLRLLPLDALDKGIPEELEALEARAADARAQYKVLAGRRAYLLSSLVSATTTDEDGVSRVSRLALELTDITSTLDTLAEDMHTMADQARQLRALLDTHLYSALAMALRKLNGSFLKQVADLQQAREAVSALEAERDEAWKQAQDAAQDLDELTGAYQNQLALHAAAVTAAAEQVPPPSAGVAPEPTTATAPDGGLASEHPIPENEETGLSTKLGARTSKMSRKSSVRASRISSSFRRSQRSSTYSFASSAASAARSTFNDIPPVPVMPIGRRPLAVRTSDVAERVSYALSSASPITGVGSADVAMVEAQKQLYAMLGISPVDLIERPRRVSRRLSFSASPSETRPVSALPRPSSANGLRPLSFQVRSDSEPSVANAKLNYF